MEVSRRNEATVEQALRRMDAKILEQQKRVDDLMGGMSSFAARVAELERMVANQMAVSIGGGATVKS